MRFARGAKTTFLALSLLSLFLLLQYNFSAQNFDPLIRGLTIYSFWTSTNCQSYSNASNASAPIRALEIRLERSRRRVESIGDSMYFVSYYWLLAGTENKFTTSTNTTNTSIVLPQRDLLQRDLLDDLRDKATTLSNIVQQAGDTLTQLDSHYLLPLNSTFMKVQQWTRNYLKNLSSLPEFANNSSSTNLTLQFVLSSRQQLTDLLNTWRFYSDACLNRSARIDALKDKLIQRWNKQQFPQNCLTAKKLHCSKSNVGGFAVNIRWITYCFWLAYVSGRVLQYNPIGWYYKAEPWDSVFLPITNCTDVDSRASYFSDKTKDELNVKLVFDELQTWYYPENRLRSIPLDIADDLQLVDLDPFEFIGGLVAGFVIKLQPNVQSRIENEVKLMNLSHPIVGIHVRRTDKITEVAYQPLDAYFNAAEAYFSQLDSLDKPESNTSTFTSSIKRRVLIATDEANVISEARKKFPHYEILANDFRASSAGMSSRKSNESLFNLLVDLYSVSATDYIVCTMSSNVCKLLHQLRQMDLVKAHNTYFVDLIFPEEFFGQRPRKFKVAFAQAKDSIRLAQDTQPKQNVTKGKPEFDYLVTEVGDVIDFQQYKPYGLAIGVNSRTKQRGLFYMFKTEEVFNCFVDNLHID